MSKTAELIYKIKADASRFVKELRKAELSTKVFSKENKRTFGQISKFAAGATIAVAAMSTALAVKSVQAAGDFEQAITTAAAKTGDFESSMGSFREAALRAGAASAFSGQQAAEGLGIMATAGYSATEAITALPSVLTLATAGQVELGQATEIAGTIMAGFSLQAAELANVGDILVEASSNSRTTLESLGSSFEKVGGLASSAGMSLEETAAAIGLLGNAGIQGERAGTGLVGILGSLLNTTPKAAAALENMGVKVRDASGEMKSIIEIVSDLEAAGMTAGEALEIFGREAGPSMVALVNQGGAALADMTRQLEESGGAAEELERRQLATLNGQLQILEGSLETVAIKFGEAFVPMVTEATTATTGFANSMAESDEKIKGLQRSAGTTMVALSGFVEMVGILGGSLAMTSGVVQDLARVFPLAGSAITMYLGVLTQSADLLTLGLIPQIGEANDKMWELTKDWGSTALDFGDSTKRATGYGYDFVNSTRQIAAGMRNIGNSSIEAAAEIDGVTKSMEDLQKQEIERAQMRAQLTAFGGFAPVDFSGPGNIFDTAPSPQVTPQDLEPPARSGGGDSAAKQAADEAERELDRLLSTVNSWQKDMQTPFEAFEEDLATLHSAWMDPDSGLTDENVQEITRYLEELHDPMGKFAAEAERAQEAMRMEKEAIALGQAMDTQASEVIAAYNGIDLAAQAHLQSLEELRDTGRITWEQYEFAVQQAAGGAVESINHIEGMGRQSLEMLGGHVVDYVVDPFNSSIEDMVAGFSKAMARMALEAGVQLAINAALGGGGGGIGGAIAQSFATGGPVYGAGTATSDSIPAYLSDGEYVLNARATSRIGVSALDAVNFQGAKGFAGGGAVSGGGGGSGNVTIVNVSNQEEAALAAQRSPAGDSVIMNFIQNNASEIRSIIND